MLILGGLGILRQHLMALDLAHNGQALDAALFAGAKFLDFFHTITSRLLYPKGGRKTPVEAALLPTVPIIGYVLFSQDLFPLHEK